jgi:hypothetical protein
LENEQRLDVGLINGGGRGRPKSGAFVSHVRCLMATGLNLSRFVLSSYVLHTLVLSVLVCVSSSCLVSYKSRMFSQGCTRRNVGIGCLLPGAQKV